MDQIRLYDPPPNPTKITDSRATGYMNEFGDECWELDALEPSVIDELIQTAVTDLRDDTLWDDAVEEEAADKLVLEKISKHWTDVAQFLASKK